MFGFISSEPKKQSAKVNSPQTSGKTEPKTREEITEKTPPKTIEAEVGRSKTTLKTCENEAQKPQEVPGSRPTTPGDDKDKYQETETGETKEEIFGVEKTETKTKSETKKPPKVCLNWFPFYLKNSLPVKLRKSF
jgi:hypothetical protein